MRLIINEIIPREIIHYADDDMIISSHHRSIFIKRNNTEHYFKLPQSFPYNVIGLNRLSRRALRLDKCNVFPVHEGLIVIRQGIVYYYDIEHNVLHRTLQLKNCRNVLHQSIATTGAGEIYFGEYGSNSNRLSVPVYRSTDNGKSWKEIFSFPKGKIKHVHGCYWDPYENKIWVFTGDFENECYLLCADNKFDSIEWIGDGSQVFRACNAFFEKDSLYWIMDSQLEDSYLVRMDRKTRGIQKLKAFPGPVWYIKRLTDGYYMAATANEIGPGVKDNYAYLFVSENLVDWERVYQIEHDRYPKRYFKFGVIGFADGNQTSKSFYMFFEALKGYDGKSVKCELTK